MSWRHGWWHNLPWLGVILFWHTQVLAGVANVEKFTHNQMHFLLAQDRSIGNITFGINFATGSLADPVGKEGLTQITMDMLLRGSQQRSRDQINEAIESIGANIDTSAGLNSTSIMGETLSRFQNEFFALMGEVLLQPNFSEAELKRLKDETFDLMKLSLNDDGYLARRNFLKHVYGDHPYGRASDTSIASISNISLADVKARYAEILHKGWATVYGAGDLSIDDLKKISDQFLQKIPAGGERLAKIKPPVITHKRRLIIVDKPDRQQVQLYLGHPTMAANDPDYFPLMIANTAFGGLFKSRYQNEIRVKRGLSYGASSSLSLNREGGVFSMRTFTAQANLATVVKISLSMLQELIDKGITTVELDKARSNLIHEFPFMLDSAEKRVQEALRIELYDLPKNYLDTYQEKLRKVDLAQVQSALKRQLHADSVTIVAVCAAKACRDELKAAIESLDKIDVIPYDRI